METKASTKKKQKLTQTRSLDDLPEQVLTHILTFIPTLDAVGTSLLSRQWRSRKLWRSLPFLDFDINYFDLRYKVLDPLDACTHFANFINQTLKNRSGFPIQKFRIHFDPEVPGELLQRMESKLGGWISYAVFHKATELDIMLPGTSMYDFYFNLLNNSCVRDVSFDSGKLRHGLTSLNLDSIRSVSLDEIDLTDDMAMDLISCFNNIESLVLVCSHGIDRLRICSSSLKKLSLDDIEGYSVEICCPNLSSLHISNLWISKFRIKHSASLEAEVNLTYRDEDDTIDDLKWWSKVLRALTNVKRLSVENYILELFSKNEISLKGFVFENLNHLELETGWGNCDLLGMAALFKICPNITTLTLDFSWLVDNGLVRKKLLNKPIKFNIPNLKILNLKNTKSEKIKELLRLMKKHGTVLEKIIVWEHNVVVPSWAIGN